MKTLLFNFIIISFAFTGCVKETAKNNSPEHAVFITVDKLFKAFEQRDTLSHDTLWLKTPELVAFGIYDKAEYFGWDEMRSHIVQSSRFLQAVHFTIHCKEIRLSQSKTVAWFAVIADQQFQTPAGVTENRNIRYTGILEKHGNRWLISQFHGSIPNKAESR